MKSWSLTEVVEINQNTTKTNIRSFSLKAFFSLNCKIHIWHSIILWYVSSHLQTQNQNHSLGMNSNVRPDLRLFFGLVELAQEDSIRYKRLCKPQQTAMRCSNALSLCTTQTSPQKRHFSQSPVCFETPWGSECDSEALWWIRLWSTILVLPYR